MPTLSSAPLNSQIQLTFDGNRPFRSLEGCVDLICGSQCIRPVGNTLLNHTDQSLQRQIDWRPFHMKVACGGMQVCSNRVELLIELCQLIASSLDPRGQFSEALGDRPDFGELTGIGETNRPGGVVAIERERERFRCFMTEILAMLFPSLVSGEAQGSCSLIIHDVGRRPNGGQSR